MKKIVEDQKKAQALSKKLIRKIMLDAEVGKDMCILLDLLHYRLQLLEEIWKLEQ